MAGAIGGAGVTAAGVSSGVSAERPRIAVLPPEIAARIAAGEVIERPASVVKELLENALDAGATRIEVTIEGGGSERIRVRDDGCGIPADQVVEAFQRHATSKLRRAEELYAVATLGFRGEALASIAAAAEVDLTTRAAGATAATVARVRDGVLVGVGVAAAAPGTTIEARELFAALPARRRFLRSAGSEARAVTQVVADYALAYPAVAFRLESEGRELLRAPGGGALRDAVRAIHGPAVAEALLELTHEAAADGDEGEPEPPRALVRGLIGPPSLHRANRRYLHLFVNGRAIGSRAIVAAIEQGYAGLIPAGRHPLAAIAIELPGEQVDVNVHPTKAEVRFRYERFVFAAVRRAVLEALAAQPSVASGESWLAGVARPLGGSFAGRSVVAGARPAPQPGRFGPEGGPAVASPFAQRGAPASLEGPAPGDAGGEAPPFAAPFATGVSALRPLGQVDRTYLVAEAADGLVLVDQHAAHERVLYERVRAARARGDGTPDGGALAQPLLQAAVVELSAGQWALAASLAAELAAVGWVLEPADGAALIVRAVPATLHGDALRRDSLDAALALSEQLDAIEAEERLTGPDRVAAALACRAAVRAGDALAAEQQRALLAALEAAETPQSCPHGRPTMLYLGHDALAGAFGRR